MLISREFAFSAAHKLTGNEGEPLHGHNYRLRITLKGAVRKDGMVHETATMKQIVDDVILKKLHKSYINDFIPQPTMENLVKWIWKELVDMPLHEIRLWESENSFVSYNGED
jgi:6-pyruvoyltetrahydropterin/6-carboxytetrahydropterin synthase